MRIVFCMYFKSIYSIVDGTAFLMYFKLYDTYFQTQQPLIINKAFFGTNQPNLLFHYIFFVNQIHNYRTLESEVLGAVLPHNLSIGTFEGNFNAVLKPGLRPDPHIALLCSAALNKFHLVTVKATRNHLMTGRNYFAQSAENLVRKMDKLCNF